MCGDAKVTELQLPAVTDEDVERRKVSMERLTSVQCIECSQDCRNLAPDKSLGLRAAASQPGTEVAVFGVLGREAVPHSAAIDFSKAIEDAKRPLFAAE